NNLEPARCFVGKVSNPSRRRRHSGPKPIVSNSMRGCRIRGRSERANVPSTTIWRGPTTGCEAGYIDASRRFGRGRRRALLRGFVGCGSLWAGGIETLDSPVCPLGASWPHPHRHILIQHILNASLGGHRVHYCRELGAEAVLQLSLTVREV